MSGDREEIREAGLVKLIFKYPLSLRAAKNQFAIPERAKFLCAKMQRGIPCLWFEVNAKNILEPRFFKMIGTGQEFGGGEYLGTVLLDKDNLVLHIYEVDADEWWSRR